MKKNKKHKWKYQINIKKKILATVILGIILFVGLGFAILESNLEIFGTLEVGKYDKTLYAALKREVGKGYALKYTGAHQDSMDPTKSTKDIYHFYASTNDKGTDILNKNNVVFADTCWQMIRTTDTGGVRLLYNGEPEITTVNNETRYNCGDTRNNYHLGEILTTERLSSTYLYAKNYTASTSGTTTTFTLVDDPNDPNDTYTVNITPENADTEIPYIVENYPYTCRNTTGTCTKSYFYKIVSQNSEIIANVYTSTERDNIGNSFYNEISENTSLAYVGYMYGDVYTTHKLDIGVVEDFITTQSMFSSRSFSTSYKYSKVLNQTGTSTVYELNNPISGSDITDQDYSGYYTYRNSRTVSGAEPYYIVGKKGTGTDYYFVRLSDTKTLTDFSIMVGTDLVDNGNGTYTIKNGTNQALEVTPDDWYSNYANYVNKYTCGDANSTCQNPRYITTATIADYKYIQNAQEKFTIAKIRNIASDYVTVSKVDWYNGYNTTYNDYIYACGNADVTCAEANLRYITGRTATSYTYAPNYYFGSSVKYENNVYKLQNTITIENARDLTNVSTHHYTCVTPSETECASVAYVYEYNGGNNMKYIELSDSNITSVGAALDAMFNKNISDSTIKSKIDKWYEDKIKDTAYESKLDDTIYCNDRSYPETSTTIVNAFAESGWNDNGGMTNKSLFFKESLKTTNLNCTRITDKFSVTNEAAKLNYKIALLSVPEVKLLNKDTARKADSSYWLISPYDFMGGNAEISEIITSGSLFSSPSDTPQGVRPAISLVSGTEYSSGDGSMTNPYIVDMSN